MTWTHLSTEVAEEFAPLVHATPPLEKYRSCIVASEVRYRMWVTREWARLPEELRARVEHIMRSESAKARCAEEKRLAILDAPPKPRKKPTPRVAPALTKYQADYQKRKSMREKLSDDRKGMTHHFEITYKNSEGLVDTFDGYLTTGEYEDGRLGEFFIKAGKDSNAHAMLDLWAMSTSVALQHGADCKSLLRKFVGTRFSPAGSTSNPEISRCTSVADYVSRWLLKKFCKEEELVLEESTLAGGAP